ncbi:MAG: hypothetical protein K0Q95_3330 [Bacteroidota bacterium]|jgi:hypothetical protein|nr:hypothetical protein [Bacteroidota bacterium]
MKKLLKRFNIPYRLILSVVAGIATAAILTVLTHFILYLFGVLPKPLSPMFDTEHVMADLIYHSVFAIAGAYVTAWLAREQAKKAVFILGTKEAIMWGVGIILLWNHAPFWVNLTKAVLGPPLAWFGGWLYRMYKTRRAPHIDEA